MQSGIIREAMRGDSYPEITIQKRTKKDYNKIDENMFKRAKAEVVRTAKLEAERKKKGISIDGP